MRLITTFPDGTTVHATDNDDAESIALAADLGYRTTGAMSFDHEILHTALANWLGLRYSPALWHVAHPDYEVSEHVLKLEEAAVLAIQKFAKAVT